MKKNMVMILAVCVLCFAAGILAGVLGSGNGKETTSGESTALFEGTETEPLTAALVTEALTEPGVEKITEDTEMNTNTTQTPAQTQVSKDNYEKEDNDSSDHSEPDPTPDTDSTPEPEPEPGNSGDGEDMEWSPDIM